VQWSSLFEVFGLCVDGITFSFTESGSLRALWWLGVAVFCCVGGATKVAGFHLGYWE
jgi:hypothetical protein